VTMQIKALDLARQARSERLGKMRLYCSTRHVPSAIMYEVLQWTVADQDFASKYVGRARLGMLPASMRGPLLQLMYANLLDSFPFKKGGISGPGVNALLIRLNPLVTLRGMGIIEPNSISTTLYVLQKGCMRIALPKEKKKEKGGDQKTRMRSARVSTSPLRGAKGGGLGLKSTKDFTRFRVMERPGATVGIGSLDNLHMRYPFHVDCTSTTQLFAITADGLKQAKDSMASDDKKKFDDVLAKEHKAHVDGLKWEPALQGDAKKAEPKKEIERSEEYIEASHQVDGLLASMRMALSTLKTTRDQTRSVSTLLKQLGGDVKSPRTTKRHKRGSASTATKSHRDGAQEAYDDIEERTGMATSDANVAAVRAALG